jgi:hypothetical protein
MPRRLPSPASKWAFPSPNHIALQETNICAQLTRDLLGSERALLSATGTKRTAAERSGMGAMIARARADRRGLLDTDKRRIARRARVLVPRSHPQFVTDCLGEYAPVRHDRQFWFHRVVALAQHLGSRSLRRVPQIKRKEISC